MLLLRPYQDDASGMTLSQLGQVAGTTVKHMNSKYNKTDPGRSSSLQRATKV